MVRWDYEIDIKEEWKKTKEKEMSISDLCNVIISKIETKLKKIDSFDKEDLLEEFKMLAEDMNADVEDFDELWDQFYDFCDTNRIWVRIV